jgi:hypothetical protein
MGTPREAALAHQSYLQNATKVRAIPIAALPRIEVSHHVLGETPEPENTNQPNSSGRDRFRTCDIRLVRPALYR